MHPNSRLLREWFGVRLTVTPEPIGWFGVRYCEGGSMGYQGGGGFGGPREMHKAICAECKKECEVPFKPREDRPIYCKDCYSKRKNEGR